MKANSCRLYLIHEAHFSNFEVKWAEFLLGPKRRDRSATEMLLGAYLSLLHVQRPFLVRVARAFCTCSIQRDCGRNTRVASEGTRARVLRVSRARFSGQLVDLTE